MRCKAKNRNGAQCGARAVKGTAVCRMHGGSARQVRAKGQERLEEARAAQVLARRGLEPIGHPLVELSRLASEVLAFKDVLAERIASGAVEGPALMAYERALDRSNRVLADLARLDLDERLARLTEQQGALIVEVMLGTFLELRLTDAQVQEAKQIMARRLQRAQIGSGPSQTAFTSTERQREPSAEYNRRRPAGQRGAANLEQIGTQTEDLL